MGPSNAVLRTKSWSSVTPSISAGEDRCEHGNQGPGDTFKAAQDPEIDPVKVLGQSIEIDARTATCRRWMG